MKFTAFLILEISEAILVAAGVFVGVYVAFFIVDFIRDFQ